MAQDLFQRELIDALRGFGLLETVVAPHLYDLAPQGSTLKYLRSIVGDMIVLSWLYPRAAYWVLDANGVAGRMGATSFLPEEERESDSAEAVVPGGAQRPPRTIWCIDLRATDAVAPLVAEIERILFVSGRMAALPAATEATGPEPARLFDEPLAARWYPVVDYGRCTHCGECVKVCRRGVFGVNEGGTVGVARPDACGNCCPECNCTCPARAIMFPQHQDPSIAGDGASATDGVGW
jgi:NAD-dependent dihydropyrimidine dehydrogenase PreA subunit